MKRIFSQNIKIEEQLSFIKIIFDCFMEIYTGRYSMENIVQTFSWKKKEKLGIFKATDEDIPQNDNFTRLI